MCNVQAQKAVAGRDAGRDTAGSCGCTIQDARGGKVVEMAHFGGDGGRVDYLQMARYDAGWMALRTEKLPALPSSMAT